MRVKIIVLVAIGSFVFASCQKKQCPAYGKYEIKAEKTTQNV